MNGWQTLLYKEVLRFWKVGFQTVGAPVLTAVLYLMIFGHVLEDHVKIYDSVSYTAFLLPGLVMMSILQNSFANSSSSLIQSKVMGNLVFLLLTPLSHWNWFFAYVGSSVARGMVVGGEAALLAAQQLLAQLTQLAAAVMQVDATQVQRRAGAMLPRREPPSVGPPALAASSRIRPTTALLFQAKYRLSWHCNDLQ
jgi:hypothetical protein